MGTQERYRFFLDTCDAEGLKDVMRETGETMSSENVAMLRRNIRSLKSAGRNAGSLFNELSGLRAILEEVDGNGKVL